MLERLRQALRSRMFAVLLLVALGLVALAYQFDTAHTVDVGDYYDRVYVSGFHDREPAPDGESFRWSTAGATVSFPDVGARGRWLSIRMHGWRPAGRPAAEVRVSVNDHYLGSVAAGNAWQEYLFWVPPQAGDGGTLRVTLQTDPFSPAESGLGSDPRMLGVAVTQVRLLPPGGDGIAPGWPAWGQLGLVLLSAALLYLGLAAVGLAPRWAALAGGVAAALLAWALAWHRLWTTIYTPRLAIVAGLGLLLTLLADRLLRRLLAWGRIAATEREVRLLLAILLVGFILKAGGLLYPYSIAWDLKLQLQWSSWIWDGRLAELYGTRSPLQERTMPPEWQKRPLIPYSPYYHITAASFFLLPWRPYDTANVLNVLLDGTKPLMLYFIARRLGLGRRVGLGAALLYALFPATFLLLAWGNAPTMAGLWWIMAATTYFVGTWDRLRRPRTWLGLVFFILGALLFYTVFAVFTAIFFGILLVGLARQRRRLPGRPAGPAALALATAIALALLIYYGQFVGPLLTQTIPTLLEAARQGGAGLGTTPVSWPEYLRANLERLGGLNYGLLLPILLALGSLATGWRHAESPSAPRSLRRWLLGAWFGTTLLFFIVGFRVDMVDKEIWFAMPAIALCGAVTLEWFRRRGRTGRAFALLIYLFLAAAALLSWIGRLATIRQDWVAADARVVGEFLRSLPVLVS